MGRAWDSPDTIAFSSEFWNEVYRILVPGGPVKAMGGTRTFHRLVQSVKGAGFNLLDLDTWSYGQGFPKSLNVSKFLRKSGDEDNAKIWKGYGSALKPSWEPIVCARKPL